MSEQDFQNADLSQTPVFTEEVAEEVKGNPQKDPEPEQEQSLGEILSVFPDAPDDTQIEKWKQVHGEVLCSGLSNTELFMFRPITRDEFVNLQAFISNAKEPISNYAVERKVVETCLLYATPPGLQAMEKKAGTLTTLQEQILQASYFINPAYASQFVIKL